MTNVDVNLDQLLEAGAHFGHVAKRWNPRMAPFIFCVREGIHIFDLIKTREAFIVALDVLESASRQNKTILFVGTKKQAKEKVAEVAKTTESPYVTERWLGGTLTNFDQLMNSVKKLNEFKEKMEKGEFSEYTKKERLLISRKIEKMEKSIGGMRQLKKRPDLIVVVDTHREIGVVTEAARMGIPTVGIVDSNADPTKVTYPVPMNDDAAKSLDYALTLMRDSILEGKKVIPEKKAEAKPKKASTAKAKEAKDVKSKS